MSAVNNFDVDSTSDEYNYSVADQAQGQVRKNSLSDGSIDSTIYKNMFDEDPLEGVSDDSEANSPDGAASFNEKHDALSNSMQNGGAYSLPSNAMNHEGVQQMGSTIHDTSRTATMGIVTPAHLGEIPNGISGNSWNHGGGGQMLRQEPSMAESNMTLQSQTATVNGHVPSKYDQTAYAGLAQTQSAMAPSRAISSAEETMKTAPETSQIERDLEAVASMYNMQGTNINSNLSTPGSQPVAVSSPPSSDSAITVTRKGNKTVASGEGVVIELLDDDVDDQIAISESGPPDDPNKRRKLLNGVALKGKIAGGVAFADPKTIAAAAEAAAAAATARRASMPDWMTKKRSLNQHQQSMQRKAVPIQRPTAMQRQEATYSSSNPSTAVQRPETAYSSSNPSTSYSTQPSAAYPGTSSGNSDSVIHEPTFIELPDGFVPTWQLLYPMIRRQQRNEHKFFELSLLNVAEFTITGLPLSEGLAPTPVTGLRSKIKEIARPHGKPVFEKDKEGVGGKWRIPLGAYRTFFSYLNSDTMTRVIGIPENQLKIASLGKARLERGFPSVGKIMAKGVPRGLATTLAPFQRGGVDFVAERKGRALIADEMGLGKTIQSIASLAMYWEEWPLLILTPSSARYHWENEFLHWLGVDSAVNNNMGSVNGLDFGGDDESTDEKEEYDLAALEARTMPLLRKSQIHVLASSKDRLFPTADTKVVICSYGLAPTLVANQQITPGLFRCAIVDESHMLKNMKSQRTSRLVPVLHATNRCVLLSGTPAFARPSELFPQLKILSTEQDTWWGDERIFVQKYVKRTTPARRAELFAMLTGTIMIRRLKSDMLKSMPKKIREKVLTDVVSPEQRREFHRCMQMLREGKGVLGQLAKEHSALDTVDDHDTHAVALSNEKSNQRQDTQAARSDLVQQYQQRYQEKMRSVQYALQANHHQLNPSEQQQFMDQQQYRARIELDSWYKEQMHKLNQQDSMVEEAEDTRKTVLNRMYTLTATAKIPFITEMIKQWLADPTKGKLCVFAHHKFVLNDLIKLTGLSNEPGSTKRYIRIDGSTAPKLRQAQINTFQTDPDVKIAILGITAAGVAVTLTASSTVWFSELFWTPALMIQAEDRCHRIGQNSRVNCLYFVAKGTLDELLWKLLEKKFRDLGEFVEGQEKMKIVVDKIYHGEKEFRSIFSKPEDDEASEDPIKFDDFGGGEETGESVFDLDDDIMGDITMLGNEEMTKNLTPQADDDGTDPQSKMPVESTALPAPEKQAALGTSEDDAIDLLSDDEDETPPSTLGSATSQPVASKSKQMVSSANGTGTPKKNRCYNSLFDGPSFGIQLVLYKNRPFVAKRTTTTPSKPAIGDILVAINGSTLPLLSDVNQIIGGMKRLIANGSVELTFMEFHGLKPQQKLSPGPQRIAQHMVPASTQNHGSNEVIELSDDDD